MKFMFKLLMLALTFGLVKTGSAQSVTLPCSGQPTSPWVQLTDTTYRIEQNVYVSQNVCKGVGTLVSITPPVGTKYAWRYQTQWHPCLGVTSWSPNAVLFTTMTNATKSAITPQVCSTGNNLPISIATSTSILTPDSVSNGGVINIVVTLKSSNGVKVPPPHTVIGTLSTGAGVATGVINPFALQTSDTTYRSTFSATAAGTPITLMVAIDGTIFLTNTIKVSSAVAPTPSIVFTVNPAITFAISTFIYGVNFANDSGSWGNAAPPTSAVTFNRMGGNRMSAYNWENNYSNSGNDNSFTNDQYMYGTTAVGGAVSSRASPTFANGQAFMATIPLLGYVAADASGGTGSGATGLATRLSTRFKVSLPTKGSAFTLTPLTSDANVYQDEFVNWMETVFPGKSSSTTTPLFYSLDNEVDLWSSTHAEVRPQLLGYAEFSDKAVTYATMIKLRAPNALVFAPALATYAGYATLGRYPTPDSLYGTQNFLDIFLARMSLASTSAGKRLIDVLDVHYYPEMVSNGNGITNDYAVQDSAMVYQRLQAPRSLWDTTYTDNSWVTGVTGGPLKLLPRLRGQIAAGYPNTKLAITEYYYGNAGQIDGGIAQADVLGIFGREGVYAASLWPIAGIYASTYAGNGNLAYAYAWCAYKMFRNFDGAGSAFGSTGLQATTSNVPLSSIYASKDATNRIILVAINKASTPQITRINVTGVTTGAGVAYVMKNGTPTPTKVAQIPAYNGSLYYTMPALSVTTIIVQ